jgi:hypothetical protein
LGVLLRESALRCVLCVALQRALLSPVCTARVFGAKMQSGAK